MEGWICPKCRRALAPWISECPCYLTNAQITCTQTGTTTNISKPSEALDTQITCDRTSTTNVGKPLTNYRDGKCDKMCVHKTDLGYCRYTACIIPSYGGDPDYGIGNGA